MEHLTHGWEPDLDSGDSLLRSFVDALAAKATELTRRVGGPVLTSDVVVAADPHSAVLFDNIAILRQPAEYADLRAAAQTVLEFFPPQRHFAMFSAFPTPDFSDLGFALMGHPPFMFRAPGGVAPPRPAGLEVVEVLDGAGLAEFIGTLGEAYPMPGAEGSALTNEAVLGDDVRLFVGRLDGRAVATSGAFLSHGINDVEWISTHPSARGRGIGAYMTWLATTARADWPAVLIASDDGQPVYEAMGYVRLMRLTMWHRPPTSSA